MVAHNDSVKSVALAALMSVLLTACGGGGGSSGGGSSNTGSGGGSSPTSSTISGTAATGTPLQSATVILTDSQGFAHQTTTNASGTFLFDVSKFPSPYLLKVTSGTNTYYSVATSDDVNKTVNVSPLTTVVAAYALGDSDIATAFTRGFDKTRLDLAEQEAGALAYQAYVNAGLQNQIDSINVRTTPIKQIHQGGDKVLDQVASVTLTGSGASTQATITLTDAQTFSGVYKPISLNQQPDVTYQNPAVTFDCASTTDHAAYETSDLIVFGVNGTSDQAKQQTAKYAQAAITKLKAQYGIADSTVGINGSKIAICAKKNGPMGGIANNRGINVFSLDSDSIDPQYTRNNNAGYKQLLHHELTHVLQSVLVNYSQENNLLARWFAEGQATFSSNQLIKWDSISVQQWQASHLNPISMTASNSDPSTQNDTLYYPMYGLAIHYLLDTTTHGGAGNKLSDLVKLLQDIGVSSGGYQGAGQDVSYFETAFANRIKIGGQPLTVADFQANFYTYILTYLRGLETAGTVSGAQNVVGVALFAQNADIAQDETVSEGGVSNGSFTLNVSNVPDGQYVLVFAQSGTNNSSVLRKCPTLVTVTNGRLTTTSFMIDTSWSSTNRTN